MPLKLVPPRTGKSPNWTIRGSYLGVAVDASTGTHRKALARRRLAELAGRIERGEYPAVAASDKPGELTFLGAAVAYMKAGRPRRYLAPLIERFGETPISAIDQAAIDRAAIEMYPAVTACTRNKYVYTPVSAILHHAGVDITVKRPKGSKGRVITDWLSPEDAAAIIRAADGYDHELAALLTFLLYTGVRLGEALRLQWEDVRLEEGVAWVRRGKGGIESDVRLRPDLIARLKAHHHESAPGRIFRFRQGGHMKHLLVRAKLGALGIACPARRPTGWRPPKYRLAWANYHTFRHTWATWMRRYGGADTKSLVATNNWRDERSAARYAHAVAREEWERVDELPGLGENVERRAKG